MPESLSEKFIANQLPSLSDLRALQRMLHKECLPVSKGVLDKHEAIFCCTIVQDHRYPFFADAISTNTKPSDTEPLIGGS